MEKSRTVRTLAALLMMLALVLPVAPPAQAHLSGGLVPVVNSPQGAQLDQADCTISADGTARYFVTVQSSTGIDIPNAAGRLIFVGDAGTPGNPGSPGGPPTTVNLSNGDFESQAGDGNQNSCVPAVNDGHANDLGSPFVIAHPGAPPPGDPRLGLAAWNMVITAGGFLPQTLGAIPDVAGVGGLPTDGVGNCTPNFAADRAGCLISLGTIQLNPLGAPAGRGVVAGSIFRSDGRPLDGATITLRDASGNVHTRTSGSDCQNAGLVAARAGTGFYCFDDQSTDLAAPVAGNIAGPEDGLGLPIGPAVLTVVHNLPPQNCGPGLNAPPGGVCGFLPATVTVNVAAATVSGQDIQLQNKFAPVTPALTATTVGAFGYVVNDAGQGVGGITITASTGQAAVTSTQTGLWAMGGLAPGIPVTFTISGPGLSVANVRPSLSITRTTGPAVDRPAAEPDGTWIDPSWIITLSVAPLGTTLPIVGSTVIRGQVLDSQGIPFTGAGAFVVLYRNGVRDIAQATNWAGGLPTINPVRNFGFNPFSNNPIFAAAAALDSGGNYCFGASPVVTAGVQTTTCTALPLVPDEYIVTVIDDRPVACVAGFQPPPGGIGPAPCGHLPQTSQPVIAQSDRIATVNFQLQARFSPGANPLTFAPGAPFVGVVNPGDATGVFGFLWDVGVPGGRPIQGQTVYAVPVPAGITAPGASIGSAAGFLNFVAQVPLTGLGVLGGAVQTSNPPPINIGIPFPTYPGSDPFGMYRIVGLAPGVAYAIIVEVPQGYTNCAPFNVQVGIPTLGYPFGQTGILNPTGIMRCAVFVTTPTAAAAATTPWVGGVDFGMAPQLLRPVEPGEIDRRLEHVLPLIANGAPTAPLGGWDVNTTEIHVSNAGAQRTVAEVRFYASDGLGGAGVLAGTATADLMPGGKRVFRGAEIPGGFLGWAGVWSFDADGPGGVYGASSLAVVRSVAVRNADNAMESIAGISREQLASPQHDVIVPMVFKNYGGTANKWSSLVVSTNVGDSAPVVFSFRAQERVRGDARSCQPCLITRYANRGGLISLNLGDENDPEMALLGDGVYSINIQAGGPLVPSGTRGIVPGATLVNNLPGGHVAEVLNVSVSGKMVTKSKTQQRLGATTFDVDQFGQQYAPLLFNNYNGWMSAIAVTTGQDSGGTSGNVTVTFLDEGGGFVGEYSDRISQSGNLMVLYLPAFPFLPEGFRGTAVINSSAASGSFPGLAPSLAMSGSVFHVNYDRNQAMSYNLIGSGAVTHRGESLGEIPCISLGFTTCAWAADVSKTGAVSAEGGLGLNTGIRLMNVDPPQLGTGVPLGIPARVIVQYIDGAGVMWNDSTQQFQIPPFGVHSLFPAYDRRLPDSFRGTVRIMSTGNAIVAVANNVDYNVTGRDASGAYNVQYHTGRID